MKKRFSEEQIVVILQEQLAGVSVVEICKKYNISQACFYKWKKKYGGLNVSEAKRLKALELENRKLKHILADKDLEIWGYKELLEKTVHPVNVYF